MLKQKCFIFSLLAAGLLLGPCISATAQIATSTFTSDTDGWIVVDRDPSTYLFFNSHSAPVFQNSGGNPGGYIQSSDEDGEWYWRAPAKFLGNMFNAYNGTLTFDIDFQAGIDVSNDPHGVIMTGGGITLYGDFVPQPPHNIWTPHTASLNEVGWTDLATNLPANSAQMQTVLANLTVLDIHGEFGDGADTSGLDNVVLTAPVNVPEPGSFAILTGTVFFGSLLLRRRRKSG